MSLHAMSADFHSRMAGRIQTTFANVSDEMREYIKSRTDIVILNRPSEPMHVTVETRNGQPFPGPWQYRY